MPVSTGFSTRAQITKGEGHIHTDKWHRCIEHVKADSPGVEPHAVCTNSIGYAGSLNPEHRTKGRHASANPKRFKTKEGQRSARARERAAKYAGVLKFDESKHPRDKEGQFTTGGSGGGSTSGSTGTEGTEKPLTVGGHGGSKSTKRVLTEAQQEMQASLAAQAAKKPHKVKTPEEGVALILKGENVELEDTKAVHTILSKLAEHAMEAQKAGKNATNWDPCSITVKGTSLFCSEKLKTEDFPNGIPRIEMPQFKSKNPIPGSPADKLPRKDGEVDATQIFMDHLRQSGVGTESTTMLAGKLKATQAEMEGVKVAGMMKAAENPQTITNEAGEEVRNPKYRDPKKAKIIVSRDGYVVDGHHTWAASVGLDAKDGDLDNDTAMEVEVIDLPISEIYHLTIDWTKKMGLPAAGVKKWDDYALALKYVWA